jgi:hypothetical protein
VATASSLANAGGRDNAYDSIAASATDSILVAAVTGRKVRVHAFIINQGDTTPSTVTFNTKPAGAGSAIFAPLKYAANGGTTSTELSTGWFETNSGEGLSVTTGAGSTTGVGVTYSLVSP